MQLKKLYIDDYKILQDFTVDFPYDFEKYITILIGTNGSGKSTVLEVIAQIFSSVLLNEKAKFGFELWYSIRLKRNLVEGGSSLRNSTVNLKIKLFAKKKGDIIELRILDKDGKSSEKLAISNRKDWGVEFEGVSHSYFPDNIVIYYSGLSEIMKELVAPHDNQISAAYRKNNAAAKRDFFYFQKAHFGIILASLLAYEYGDIPEFLLSKAKIAKAQSIQLHLQKPEWAKKPANQFWGAEGEVKNFLDYLNENTETVEELSNPESSTRVGNIIIEIAGDESILISIVSQERLFEIKNHLGEERKLFEILNMMLTDGLLKDISFSFSNDNGEGFGILSEGEQQAIIIKGLTELLGERNSLFLFDEPDTYLHPKWHREFITDIENTVNSNLDAENSFIIATHSPQLLSNARAEQNFVKIIEKGKLIENTPKFYGREINTILYDLMGVEERNKEVRKAISKLYRLIAEEEIEEAENSLSELRELIGENDPELIRAKIQIEYLKDDL